MNTLPPEKLLGRLSRSATRRVVVRTKTGKPRVAPSRLVLSLLCWVLLVYILYGKSSAPVHLQKKRSTINV